MSTSTPRLALVKPDGAEAGSLGAGQLTSNYQKIDSAIGMSNGTAFPASPFTGKIFHRTDLNQGYYYNGAGWTPFGDATAVPPGIKQTLVNTSQIQTTTAEALIGSTTFFAINNKQHYLKISTFLEFIENVAGYGWVVLRWAPGGAVINTDTKIRDSRFYMDCIGVLGKSFCFIENFFYTGVSQNITIGIFIKSESVSQTIKSVPNPEGPGPNSYQSSTALIISEWG